MLKYNPTFSWEVKLDRIAKLSNYYSITSDGCWNWNRAKSNGGYGAIYSYKVKKLFNTGQVVAHRFFYELIYGHVPSDKTLNHLCRNRLCVNPKHLEITTSKDNLLGGIGIAAENSIKEYCSNGHKFEGNNLIIHKINGNFRQRACRTCSRHYWREYSRRKRNEHKESSEK